MGDLDPAPHRASAPAPLASAVPTAAVLLQRVDHAAQELRSSVLGDLQHYDAEHGTDLCHTLDVFLSAGGQWSKAAAQLGIHVNTLRYRLSRVEDCTGREIASTADRADFYIALRVRDTEP